MCHSMRRLVLQVVLLLASFWNGALAQDCIVNDYYSDVLLESMQTIVNSAGPCDNRPGVIGRRLSITSGGMVPVASSSQFNVSGAIHFVQPFCIALTTTIPFASESFVMARSGGDDVENPPVLFSLSQSRVLLELGSTSIDFSSVSLTDSPAHFVNLQVCLECNIATLYINCEVVATVEVADIRSSGDDAYVFFQRSILNESQQFVGTVAQFYAYTCPTGRSVNAAASAQCERLNLSCPETLQNTQLSDLFSAINDLTNQSTPGTTTSTESNGQFTTSKESNGIQTSVKNGGVALTQVTQTISLQCNTGAIIGAIIVSVAAFVITLVLVMIIVLLTIKTQRKSRYTASLSNEKSSPKDEFREYEKINIKSTQQSLVTTKLTSKGKEIGMTSSPAYGEVQSISEYQNKEEQQEEVARVYETIQ